MSKNPDLFLNVFYFGHLLILMAGMGFQMSAEQFRILIHLLGISLTCLAVFYCPLLPAWYFYPLPTISCHFITLSAPQHAKFQKLPFPLSVFCGVQTRRKSNHNLCHP